MERSRYGPLSMGAGPLHNCRGSEWAQCIVIRYMQTQPRIFRGWWIVVVACAGQCFSLGTMAVYTFGVFAKPLASEFASNRAAISLALSLLNIMVTLASP